MTTAPTQGAGALLVSVSVDAVFAAAAGQDVTPLNLVHAIAQRHSEYAGGQITALLPAPPPDAVRQPWRRGAASWGRRSRKITGSTAGPPSSCCAFWRRGRSCFDGRPRFLMILTRWRG